MKAIMPVVYRRYKEELWKAADQGLLREKHIIYFSFSSLSVGSTDKAYHTPRYLASACFIHPGHSKRDV